MSTPHDAASELEQLLSELVDGELSYLQQQHLTALLRDDPALQQKYRDYLLLDALLRWEQPQAPAVPRRRWRVLPSIVRAAALLAAGVLLAVGGYLVHSWQGHPLQKWEPRVVAVDEGDG